MNCRFCGAPGQGRICEYCGQELAPAVSQEKAPQEVQPVVQQITNVYVTQDTLFQEHPSYQGRTQSVPNTYPAPVREAAASDRKKSTALFLCVFLGFFGAHQFYTGHKKMGIAYLCTMGLCGIGWIVDIFLILFNLFKDGDGRKLRGSAGWMKWVLIILLILCVIGYTRSGQTP